MDMWTRQYNVLGPLTEEAIGSKGRSIIWKNEVEVEFCDIKQMFSSETITNYTDWIMMLTVEIDTYDIKLGAIIIQNNKPTILFSIKLSDPKCSYNKSEKELLLILEWPNQSCGTLFDYEIKTFSDHKNYSKQKLGVNIKEWWVGES